MLLAVSAFISKCEIYLFCTYCDGNGTSGWIARDTRTWINHIGLLYRKSIDISTTPTKTVLVTFVTITNLPIYAVSIYCVCSRTNQSSIYELSTIYNSLQDSSRRKVSIERKVIEDKIIQLKNSCYSDSLHTRWRKSITCIEKRVCDVCIYSGTQHLRLLRNQLNYTVVASASKDGNAAGTIGEDAWSW